MSPPQYEYQCNVLCCGATAHCPGPPDREVRILSSTPCRNSVAVLHTTLSMSKSGFNSPLWRHIMEECVSGLNGNPAKVLTQVTPGSVGSNPTSSSQDPETADQRDLVEATAIDWFRS